MAHTKVKLSMNPSQVRGYAFDEQTTMETLETLGISASPAAIKAAMDATPDLITGASTATPIQFLQHFLATPVRIVTQALTIDKIIGRKIAGTFADEEIVQPVIENVGQPRRYGDTSNTALADWNPNFEKRTITRWEMGMRVGILEEERSSAMRMNSGAEKRNAVARALAVTHNSVGFNGVNLGNNRTYGLLNDPNLPVYVTVATGTAASTLWVNKTFIEITNDIKAAVSALRLRSGSNFDPMTDGFVMAIAAASIDQLATVNTQGNLSVRGWISQTYPKARIENAPQLTAANGGANVFYVIAEAIEGAPVVDQYVQDVMRLLGVQRLTKGYEEAYASATAGVLVSQPIGVVRFTGI